MSTTSNYTSLISHFDQLSLRIKRSDSVIPQSDLLYDIEKISEIAKRSSRDLENSEKKNQELQIQNKAKTQELKNLSKKLQKLKKEK